MKAHTHKVFIFLGLFSVLLILFWLMYSTCCSRSVVSDSWQPHGLYSPWNSPGQNTGVGSCFLLQGIFPTQGSNPGLPHCRWILYHQSHQVNPWILEWVAHPFSRESSWSRNWIGVSCIAGRFFTIWATRDAPITSEEHIKNNLACSEKNSEMPGCYEQE